MPFSTRALTLSLWLGAACAAPAAPPATRPGDAGFDRYFRAQTSLLAGRCLADVKTPDDWASRREEYRRQLAEMLGLWPAPPRTDLKPVVAGTIDHGDFTVEKVVFQSRPGLYVTADLYLPKNAAAPAPAVLYVCGHSLVKKDGVSYGNKTAFQHHGAWFARNGYVCLVPDTLQLGEIEGTHHGLYRENLWWWLSRGYTPAGVEAWNGIRCLDYLQSRPEVDPQRLGMTGRSGGGAYTWYTAALDERVKAAVPVAGITDLHNHVVDGVIEGHCDCMYMTNTYRWDFAQVAALIAPRPLLICNTDKDRIFPLDGVYRLHEKVRAVYRLYGAADKLGLVITEGDHHDTQDLQVPAFRWFNRFLKQDAGPLKDATADSPFSPEQLKVLPRGERPADQLNTTIHETFVPAAGPPQVPASAEAWKQQRDRWLAELRAKTFGGWPDAPGPLDVKRASAGTDGGAEFGSYDFTSQENVPLRLYVLRSRGKPSPAAATMRVLDSAEWAAWLATMRAGFADALGDELALARPAAEPGTEPAPSPEPDRAAFARVRDRLKAGGALAWAAPRGVGLTAWGGDAKRRTHLLRRFALLGQTLEGQQAWDVRRAIQALRSVEGLAGVPLRVEARGRTAGVVLYASLFEPGVSGLTLRDLPASHRAGPDLLNVQKTLDLPAAAALAAERCDVLLEQPDGAAWDYPRAVAERLHWGTKRFVVDKGESPDSK